MTSTDRQASLDSVAAAETAQRAVARLSTGARQSCTLWKALLPPIEESRTDDEHSSPVRVEGKIAEGR